MTACPFFISVEAEVCPTSVSELSLSSAWGLQLYPDLGHTIGRSLARLCIVTYQLCWMIADVWCLFCFGFFPQPPPKLPNGVFGSEFQDFVNKWWVAKGHIWDQPCRLTVSVTWESEALLVDLGKCGVISISIILFLQLLMCLKLTLQAPAWQYMHPKRTPKRREILLFKIRSLPLCAICVSTFSALKRPQYLRTVIINTLLKQDPCFYGLPSPHSAATIP